MDYDLILKQAKNLDSDYKDFVNKKKFKDNTFEELQIKMEKEYEYLNTNVNSIFKSCINGNLDTAVLTYMIQQAKSIKKNKISNYDASVNVGTKLVEKFIKPKIDNKK